MKPSRAHVLKEAELLRRTVQVLPNGPLLDYLQAFGEQELKAPNAAGTLGATAWVAQPPSWLLA